jgi:diguanylate cyclase (GGDEF)-like protein
MTESCSSKPTVLVVDDSRLMRLAARKILKNDFEILEAEDGEVAWDKLQDNNEITLVMSDLSMPNLDGLGLLKKIRESSQPELKELPVIIVTGAEDDDGSKKTAFSAGASDFITKPFESVQLLARAQAQAKQQRTQQALQNSETSKQQLEDHSSVDLLTGLPNQRAFTDSVEEKLSYAVRHKTGLALLLIQIDKYKILFLRQGKKTAESVLQRIAEILSEGRRREDTVARISLDSFAVLLPSATEEGAGQVARQLHRAVREETFGSSGDNPLSASLSIAVSSPSLHSDTGLDATQLLAGAHETLRQALAAGGDRVQGVNSQTATAPQAPADKILPEPETIVPVPPAVASSDDVQRALQALSAGRHPEISADALARAVLPLLDNWDQSLNSRYTTLIEQFKSALEIADGDEPVSGASPDSAIQSL